MNGKLQPGATTMGFTLVLANATELDIELAHFTQRLATYNQMHLLKIEKIIWEGTNHWDTLLQKRAAITGKLVLSDYAKKCLRAKKKK
jgi:methylglutaconyl-CoA hydratase